MKKSILLINCKDNKGIIASVTNFVHQQKGNIVYIDQHVDREDTMFFMRLECEFSKDSFSKEQFENDFENSIANKFDMNWQLHDADVKPKMAIFVSKYSHCLYDILSRFSSGEMGVEIPLIISNHPDLEKIARSFNIPYYCIKVTKETKVAAEREQLELLRKYKIDFIVLARYMQIISSRLIGEFPDKIINIHHSFLPAFPGAKPYHSAFKRGVKIIGATSHYVTEELDEGPIIEQDITRVSHIHTIKDFILKGRDLEKIVLSRALQLHTKHKVMVYNNKTVVFN
ncbi:formyltetrahydrofolate deformylase [Tenacibaculum adriaticum]|uniref:Formyltetrahydrofolate deformylase n=1 Tax=Tenacibaculum adriaticum TaxID=413713 RepID=A0A5S5DQD6_9FLAO|nr:formyltetrahydrofolate deformylase [Tenacibaculum adriaticum]TYP97945.1 formyltetrahydrofolate deformylase [Tenacibaculum adriaticum]